MLIHHSKRTYSVLLAMTFLVTPHAFGQDQPKEPVHNYVTHVLVIVDSTASMQFKCGESRRITIAQWVMSDILDLVPEGTHYGVLVLRNEVSELRALKPLEASDRSNIRRSMIELEPHGSGELKDCFETARTILQRHADSRPLVVVVTDGEDCHPGEAHGAAAELSRQFGDRLSFKLYATCTQADKSRQLRSLADSVSDESYTKLISRHELGAALKLVRERCDSVRRFHATNQLAQERSLAESKLLVAKLEKESVAREKEFLAQLETIDQLQAEAKTHTAEIEKLKTDAAMKDEAVASAKAEIEKLEQQSVTFDTVQTGLNRLQKATDASSKLLNDVDPKLDALPPWVTWPVSLGGISLLSLLGLLGIRDGRSVLDLLKNGGGASKSLDPAIDRLSTAVNNFESMSQALRQQMTSISQEVDGKVESMGRELGGIKEAVAEKSSNVKDKVDSVGKEVVGAIKEAFADKTQLVPMQVEAAGKDVTSALKDAVADKSESMTNRVDNVGREVVSALKEAVNDKTNNLSQVVDSVGKDVTRNVNDNVANQANNVSDKVDSVGTGVVNAVMDSVEEEIEQVSLQIESLESNVTSALERANSETTGESKPEPPTSDEDERQMDMTSQSPNNPNWSGGWWPTCSGWRYYWWWNNGGGSNVCGK